ncbi:MAG: alpha/beta hydrolase family protein [Janthinobacterium lividum]
MHWSRRRFLSRAAAAAATAVVLTGCSAGGARPGGAGGQEDEAVPTYHYGDHPAQFAELSLPSGSSPVGVVVIVHGGFWRDAYGAELGRPLARDLVLRGYAALNVEYRRVGRNAQAGGGGWPTTCLDVAAAVDGLAEQGQRLAGGRLDLSRVVALGHSAGGHLAGWLASRALQPSGAPGADPQVTLSGAVIQAGVVDLEGGYAANLGGGAVSAFMGGSPEDLPEAYAQASPIARVPLNVPTVCVHGRDDDVVPIGQSEAFVAAALEAGDVSELKAFDGDHSAVIDTSTEGWELCVEALGRLV